MYIFSVNIGRSQPIAYAKASGTTGIYKQPTQEPVELTALGLVGDTVVDTENHGGVDQAVYVYGTPDYAWWSAALGRELGPGIFGENLTIDGLESAQYCIGDRFEIGEVTVEVTAPRIPCVTLATRMGDPAFVKHFRMAERPGLYCRVIRTGFIQAGTPVDVARYTDATVTVLEMFRDFYTPDLSEATLRRYLAAPIAIRDRADKEARLRKLLNSQDAKRV